MAKAGRKREKHVDDSRRNVGILIEQRMNKQHVSCVDVAEFLGAMGREISPSYISYIVTGSRMPTQELLAALCTVLDIDISHAVSLYYRDLVARGTCRKEFAPGFFASPDDIIANAKTINTMLDEKIASTLNKIQGENLDNISLKAANASFSEKLAIVAYLEDILSDLRALSRSS